ncbi:MAG: FAD-dependent oxidoreductase [Acidobacteria bacterium]|nr:FAD-dependent oxidoreductase [Acidobacteriota bacterium]
MGKSPMETDVVVVGSGVAGLSAALEAALAGARVIVFEKQAALGGTSNFFEGVFAVGSAMQKQKYIAYTSDQAFRNFMEYNHWRVDARLVRTLINRSADTIDWLQALGVEFVEVTINMPDAPRTYHVVNGRGQSVVEALAQKAKRMGVVIRTSSPVKEIRKGTKGLSGVVAEMDGNDTDVACEAVVIASGGYANNPEWIEKYTGLELGKTVTAMGNTGKMGDGIRMAWAMGAAPEGMGVLHLIRVAPFGPEFPFMNSVECAAIQPVLWVDPRGERFCDEGIAYYDTSLGNVNSRYRQGYTFCLFDDTIKEYFMEKGGFRGMGQVVPPGSKLKDLDEQVERFLALNSPEFFGADSVEELARKMEVEPQVLKATVDRYNTFCVQGYDEEFAKNREFLLPLRGPRFYAAKARTCFLGTLGGIKINHKAEAVDHYGTPIAGLYAAGLDAGGLHAESYSMRDTSGITSAFAINSGRLAGENAARYLRHLREARQSS